MGEVYLAEDAQLRRQVALKILPSDLASNQDRMRRFIQEAQSAAALNHPNIARTFMKSVSTTIRRDRKTAWTRSCKTLRFNSRGITPVLSECARLAGS